MGGVSATAAAGLSTLTINGGRLKTDPTQQGIGSTVLATVSSGSVSTEFHLMILRPPLVAAGAFSIPAVPIALIYAPPPGPQNKNFAEYSNMTSVSSKISTSVGSGSSTKTATAYSTSDFIGKITGAIGAIKTFAAAIASASAATSTDADKAEKAANQRGDSLDALITLVSPFLPDNTSNTTNSLTTTSERDIQITDTDTATQGSTPGLGPGVGDRFVYVRNVKVVWMISDDALSVTLVGDGGIRAFPAQDLQSDLKAISGNVVIGTGGLGGQTAPEKAHLSGGFGGISAGPKTNIDARSILSLLQLDPFVGSIQPVLNPVLEAPRFIPNNPASFAGRGSDPSGDTFKVSHDLTTTDIATRVTTTTNISDFKPGWVEALFGTNVSTENQLPYLHRRHAEHAGAAAECDGLVFHRPN